jgi:hypothetical protein
MKGLAHEIATKAIGGTVSIATVRHPGDGSACFAVSYESRAIHWLSRHRFQDLSQADAGAVTLADFLGAQLR